MSKSRKLYGRSIWEGWVLRRWLLHPALVFLSASAILAQTAQIQVLSRIVGNVKDPSGAAVPGAEVEAVNEATNLSLTATSDDLGGYLLTNVPPGDYRVEVGADGFSTFVAVGIHVEPRQDVRLDANLQLGEITEEIEVVGAAALVDTFSNQLSTTVDERRITELPLNGRDLTSLALLAVGTAQPDGGSSWYSGSHGFSTVTVSSNGARSQDNMFLLDGLSQEYRDRNVSYPYPNPDAVSEFNLLTGQYSAEFGRLPGAVLTASTKSGGNQLHGSVFEFIRNHRLNAKHFFTHTDDGLKRHQYGWAIGGPVYIPKIVDGRNKFFWFNSVQFEPNRSVPGISNIFGPTSAEANGDYSAYLTGQMKEVSHPACDGSTMMVDQGALFDPATANLACGAKGIPFPGNIIPQSRIHPFARALANHIPLRSDPNQPSLVRRPNEHDKWQLLNRFDYNITDNNRIFVRTFINRANYPNFFDVNNIFTSAFGSNRQYDTYAVSNTWTISPKILNTFGFLHVRNPNRTLVTNYIDGDTSRPWGYTNLFEEAGIPPAFSESGDERQIAISLGNCPGCQLESGVGAGWGNKNYEFTDTLRWITGRHEFTIGGEIYLKEQRDFSSISQFRYFFTNDAAGVNRGWADMQLNSPSAIWLNNHRAPEIPKIRKYGNLFIQDNLRISSRLTINLGLRWDPYIPSYGDSKSLGDITYRASYIVLGGGQSGIFQNAPRGLLYPGDAGVPERADSFGDKSAFAPRFGFAYDPTGVGKWSIRGGIGHFITMDNRDSPSAFGGQPWKAGGGQFNLVQNVDTIDNPFVSNFGGNDPRPFPNFPQSDEPFVLPYSHWITDLNAKAGGLWQWSLTVEREVYTNAVLSAGYVGSHGHNLTTARDINFPVYIPGASSTANRDSRRPYISDGLGEIRLNETTANSHYHAMQLQLEQRYSHGFSLLANYTWSKSTDTHSTNIGWVGFSQTDPRGPAYERGLSDFDTPHNVKASFVWDIPTGGLQSAAAKAVLGGWEVTGNLQYQLGTPFTVRCGCDALASNFGGTRAMYLGGEQTLGGGRSRGAKIARWFNTDAFGLAEDGTNGTIGRNTIRGPSIFTNNFGLFKNIGLPNETNLQIRGEFFNLVNWVNLGSPNSSFSAPAFGVISSAGAARIVQLGMKILF